MLNGIKLRCYPTPTQQQTLLQWIGCQRFIYNAKVGENRYYRAYANHFLENTGLFAPIDQQYSQFKTEDTVWLKQVPSQILRNGAVLWRQAYARYFAKLAGRPTIQKKTGRQSVWITNEQFEFVKTEKGYTLLIGKNKFAIGELKYKATRVFEIPQSLHISIHNGQWHVSFCYDNGAIEPKDSETLAELQKYTEAELSAVTLGLDRGVTLPLATSANEAFVFSKVQKERLRQEERQRKRWQRRLARCVKGSKRSKKAKAKVSRYSRYSTNVRHDFAHQTSHVLADDSAYELFVFEDLKIQNMTKKAKAKPDGKGGWLKNRAAAKSALNQAILTSAWGSTYYFTLYKARRAGKLCIKIPAFYSSQECAKCGHTHPDNRVSQSEFVCQACGANANADYNAAAVIAKRGVHAVLNHEVVFKEKKDCSITGKKDKGLKIGQDLPESASADSTSLRSGNGVEPVSGSRESTGANAAAAVDAEVYLDLDKREATLLTVLVGHKDSPTTQVCVADVSGA